MRIVVTLLAAAVLLLSGCVASKDEIEVQSKALTQRIIDQNPTLKDLGMVVDRVDAIQESGNHYKGIAQIAMSGEHFTAPLSILSDGDKIMVTPDEGAFSFAAPYAFKKAMEKASAEERPTGEIERMIVDADELNNTCRDGSGDDQKTMDACEHRDAIMKGIQANGWCYQTKDPSAPAADRRWMRCQ